jgi:uncharacterized protein YxjI
MDIEDAGGKTAATIKKALIAPLRDRWKVEVTNGPVMDIQGNILDHEYKLKPGGKKLQRSQKNGSG